jgi:hypothetical protein
VIRGQSQLNQLILIDLDGQYFLVLRIGNNHAGLFLVMITWAHMLEDRDEAVFITHSKRDQISYESSAEIYSLSKCKVLKISKAI